MLLPPCRPGGGGKDSVNKQILTKRGWVPQELALGHQKGVLCVVCSYVLELAVDNSVPIRESPLHLVSSKLSSRVNSATPSKTDPCLGQRSQHRGWGYKAWDVGMVCRSRTLQSPV